ncbi:MAG: thiamine diphosphokinase [Bacteroidales bacterium]
MESKTVILADGLFPSHEIPLRYLKSAGRIVCCDGAARSLLDFGLEPLAIVGDCDSLSPQIAEKYGDRIYRVEEQETNDLTKSVNWCVERNYRDLVILGATGKREDHTIGNISLLADYARKAEVIMVTDTGFIYPVLETSEFKSFPGQYISIFSLDPETEVTSYGLKYPLKRRKLRSWWEATLNECEGRSFRLEFRGGPLLLFMKFRD